MTTSAGVDSRRNFIKKTATAAAAVAATGFIKTPVYGQNTAPSANVAGANSKLTIGFVGVGNQGLNAHLKPIVAGGAEDNVSVVAVCDVSKARLAAGTAAAPGSKSYDDYRKLLEQKDIDIVFVATVDHWHAIVATDAVNAGKNVYVEKPMSRYLGEAFTLYDAVKKTGKIVQVGSQGCSDMKWHKAADWIKAGKIGQVVMSQGSYMRNTPKGEWNFAPTPPWADRNSIPKDDVNWAMWLGDKIKTRKDFSPEDYFRWRKYYRYCAGILGDLFPHKLHPYMLATGNPEFPKRVCSVGTKAIHTDKSTPDVPERDSPEILQLIAEFPSGMVMHITSSTVNEQGTQEMIRGTKANLTMGGNSVDLKPERPYAEEIEPEKSESFAPETFTAHHKNLFQSIRANKQPNCNVDLALRVQTVVCLGEMSERLGVTCFFDEKTRKITTSDGKELQPLTYGSIENQS